MTEKNIVSWIEHYAIFDDMQSKKNVKNIKEAANIKCVS